MTRRAIAAAALALAACGGGGPLEPDPVQELAGICLVMLGVAEEVPYATFEEVRELDEERTGTGQAVNAVQWAGHECRRLAPTICGEWYEEYQWCPLERWAGREAQ